MAALYYFFLFLGNKKEKPILLFSISCFLFFALIITEFIRNYISIHYSEHHIRMLFIGYLTFFIAILVPLYFSLQFPFRKPKLILAIYTIFLIYVFYRNHHAYDGTSYNMALCMWFFSFGIVAHGVFKKFKGALIVLLALLICVFINYKTYYDTSLFAGFGVIVLGMFYILSIKAERPTNRLRKHSCAIDKTSIRVIKKEYPTALLNEQLNLIN